MVVGSGIDALPKTRSIPELELDLLPGPGPQGNINRPRIGLDSS